MSTSSSSPNISGAASGLQWNDIVDTTIKALEARTVTPITDRISLRNKQKDAWTKLQGLVDTLNSSAFAVRRAGFGGFSATMPTSPVSGRSLVTATASNTAVAGRYRVEVQQLADTAKFGGASVSDTTAARNLTGGFSVNGQAITVAATDTLADIRDKVNAAGAGVTATIVSEGGTAGRLVLTANSSGASGITLTDGTGGVARELGFLDSRSKPVSSATAAAAAALGLSLYPQPASIRVGNITITADLATESIASIAAKINAAGGSASVESEQYGNETRFRLVTDGNVTADPGDSGSQAVIDALGMAAGQAGAVRQTVQSGAFTSSADATATGATSLVGLKLDGASSGLAAGDAINIRGTRGDGTAVTYGLVVQPGDTMQTLVDRINDATSGFGSGTRPATAALGPDGRIRLTDGTGGASRLSLSLSVTHADGTSASLGTSTTAIAGRSRELQTGRDAVLVVDGQQVVRTTNTITDAIAGVTLSLQSAEVGTTLDLTVDRDTKGAVDATKKVVDAYNAIRTFFDEQRQQDAPLYADSSLRRVVNSFTEALRTTVGTNGTYTNAVNVGLVLDRDGKLTFNEKTFTDAYAAKPSEVESLFGTTGLGGAFVTAADDVTRFGEGAISTNINNILQNVYSLKGRESDALKRLEERRLQLVLQYTRMEEALGRLQQQSSALISSVAGLQGGQN
ncbi:MAG: flagellar filament capping protein FliD [Gemmatimonadetes bacterium]|nr:flagellar filament capping protein FliD [Gemmatimonadota bacterium]